MCLAFILALLGTQEVPCYGVIITYNIYFILCKTSLWVDRFLFGGIFGLKYTSGDFSSEFVI